ncbi:hypothetical protein AAMO2058_000562000 [Amorphochlora amoebiformis]
MLPCIAILAALTGLPCYATRQHPLQVEDVTDYVDLASDFDTLHKLKIPADAVESLFSGAPMELNAANPTQDYVSRENVDRRDLVDVDVNPLGKARDSLLGKPQHSLSDSLAATQSELAASSSLDKSISEAASSRAGANREKAKEFHVKIKAKIRTHSKNCKEEPCIDETPPVGVADDPVFDDPCTQPTEDDSKLQADLDAVQNAQKKLEELAKMFEDEPSHEAVKKCPSSSTLHPNATTSSAERSANATSKPSASDYPLKPQYPISNETSEGSSLVKGGKEKIDSGINGTNPPTTTEASTTTTVRLNATADSKTKVKSTAKPTNMPTTRKPTLQPTNKPTFLAGPTHLCDESILPNVSGGGKVKCANRTRLNTTGTKTNPKGGISVVGIPAGVKNETHTSSDKFLPVITPTNQTLNQTKQTLNKTPSTNKTKEDFVIDDDLPVLPHPDKKKNKTIKNMAENTTFPIANVTAPTVSIPTQTNNTIKAGVELLDNTSRIDPPHSQPPTPLPSTPTSRPTTAKPSAEITKYTAITDSPTLSAVVKNKQNSTRIPTRQPTPLIYTAPNSTNNGSTNRPTPFDLGFPQYDTARPTASTSEIPVMTNGTSTARPTPSVLTDFPTKAPTPAPIAGSTTPAGQMSRSWNIAYSELKLAVKMLKSGDLSGQDPAHRTRVINLLAELEVIKTKGEGYLVEERNHYGHHSRVHYHRKFWLSW